MTDETSKAVTTEHLQQWIADVSQAWETYWRDKFDHRYSKDFAAFVGERLLTDFDLRGRIPHDAFSGSRYDSRAAPSPSDS